MGATGHVNTLYIGKFRGVTLAGTLWPVCSDPSPLRVADSPFYVF
jgi:hypothetical protein